MPDEVLTERATGSSSSRSTGRTRATPSTRRSPQGIRRRAGRARRATTRCRSGSSRAPGKGFSAGMDLRAFVQGERPYVERSRLRRHHAARRAQAAHRRRRGLRGRGRLRDRPVLRPDRRVQGRPVRDPGGQARRSSPAPAASLRIPRRLPYGVADGARAHRRPHARRARLRARASSTGSPSRARRSTAALELAGGDRANAPLALAASKEILRRSATGAEEEFWTRQGADGRRDLRARRTPSEGATAFAEKRAPGWQGR